MIFISYSVFWPPPLLFAFGCIYIKTTCTYLFLLGENKATINKCLRECNPCPLEVLEKWWRHDKYSLREVGFCAQWCLDNLCRYRCRVSLVFLSHTIPPLLDTT